MTTDLNAALGAFTAPSPPPPDVEKPPPATEKPPPDEDEEKDPPPDDEEDLDLAQWAPPTVAWEPPPRSPSGWYRVLTPAEGFEGARLGKQFHEGECVIHARERVLYTAPGGKPQPVRLVDVFSQDLHYTVEIIPEGVPPVPRSTLTAANWKP